MQKVTSIGLIKKFNAIEGEMFKKFCHYDKNGADLRELQKYIDKQCEIKAKEIVGEYKDKFQDGKFREIVLYLLRERGAHKEKSPRRFLPVVYKVIENFEEIFNGSEKEQEIN